MVNVIDASQQFECRQHQLSLIKLFKQQLVNVSVAEWPCSGGKTCTLYADALYQSHLKPQVKIFVVVPRPVNRAIAISKLGVSQHNMTVQGRGGIFVCTQSQYFALDPQHLKGSLLVLDEFHNFMKSSKAIKYLKMHSKVHSVSATLGGEAGHERYRDLFRSNNLSFQIVKGQKEHVDEPVVDLQAVEVDAVQGRLSPRGQLLSTALEVVEDKVANGQQVILFVRNTFECKDLHKQLTAKTFADQGIQPRLLDEKNEPAVWATIAMLDAIEQGTSKVNVVVTTPASSTGINIFPRCHVVFTDKPSDFYDFMQAIGRSNRKEFNGIQEGTWVALAEEYKDPAILMSELKCKHLTASKQKVRYSQ